MSATTHRLLRDPTQIRILAFGNSLTEGYCDFGTRFHPYGIALKTTLDALLPELNVLLDINGLSGDRVLPALDGVYQDRLHQALAGAAVPYDLVLLLGGTNDLAYTFGDPEGPIKIFEGLEACYDRVLASGAALVALTVPERSLDTKDTKVAKQGRSARLELNAMIEQYVQDLQTSAGEGQERAFVMDFASEVPFALVETEDGRSEEDEGLWSVDGLHMTEKGYDHVGELLAKFVVDLLQ